MCFNGQELVGFAGQVHYLHLVETILDEATIFFWEDETTTLTKALGSIGMVLVVKSNVYCHFCLFLFLM
jgi:hypothetical protein